MTFLNAAASLDPLLGLIPEGTSVAAVLVMFVLFLRYLKDRDRAAQAREERFDTMARDCHEAQQHMQSEFRGSLRDVVGVFERASERNQRREESLIAELKEINRTLTARE